MKKKDFFLLINKELLIIWILKLLTEFSKLDLLAILLPVIFLYEYLLILIPQLIILFKFAERFCKIDDGKKLSKCLLLKLSVMPLLKKFCNFCYFLWKTTPPTHTWDLSRIGKFCLTSDSEYKKKIHVILSKWK